jgi:hypothetical protein
MSFDECRYWRRNCLTNFPATSLPELLSFLDAQVEPRIVMDADYRILGVCNPPFVKRALSPHQQACITKGLSPAIIRSSTDNNGGEITWHTSSFWAQASAGSPPPTT